MKKLLFSIIVSSCIQGALAMERQQELNNQLHSAVQAGNVDEVRRLLAAGAEVAVANKEGRYCIFYCIIPNGQHLKEEIRKEILQLLRDAHADLNAKLVSASSDGNVSEVKRLIAIGANVNAPGQHTALVCAVSNGHLEVCRVLIEAKANVNLAGYYDKKTPLMYAVNGYNNASVELTTLLLQAGADQRLKDETYGKTALLMAATCPTDKYEERCKLLVQHQKRINDGLVSALIYLKRFQLAGHPLGVLYRERKKLLEPYLEKQRYFPLSKLLAMTDGDGKRAYDHLQIDCLNPSLIKGLDPMVADNSSSSSWCSIQ